MAGKPPLLNCKKWTPKLGKKTHVGKETHFVKL